jgi:CHAT domain-containing protein/TPR repeat protein
MNLSGSISMDKFIYVARLAHLYNRHEETRPFIQKAISSFGKFALATVLLEGHSESGKQPTLASGLLQLASDEGDTAATIRLAQLFEQGWGTSKNIQKALELYRKGAEAGQPLGYLSIGRLYDEGLLIDQDIKKAETNYRSGLASLLSKPKSALKDGSAAADYDPVGDGWFADSTHSPVSIDSKYRLFNGIQQQVLKRTAFFVSPSGERLLDQVVRNNPFIAVQLGRLFMCGYCGSTIRVADAVRWYSRGVENKSMYSAYSLARLLRQYPEFETKSLSAKALLAVVVKSSSKLALEAELLLSTLQVQPASAPPDALAKRIIELCNETDETFSTECIDVAHRLAIGAVSTSLVPVGYHILELWAGRTEPKAKDVRDTARSALMDVNSYYGDFSAAITLASQLGADLSWNSYNAREQTFSQLILAIADNQTRTSSVELKSLLSVLRSRGDPQADAFYGLASGAKFRPSVAQSDSVDALRDTFETQLARGGPSQGLVVSSRALSGAFRKLGRMTDALTYELVALNAQNEVARASSVEYGPLPYRLITACQLTRSSQRIQDLGFTDVSTVLAKEAVNKLQEVRASLIGLPNHLRNCFAEITQDQYRRLFALFVDQNLLDEAKLVEGMLKNVEAYEYASLDPKYVNRAFDKLPIFDIDQKVLEQAFAVKPSGGDLSGRFAWLRQRRAGNTITPPESLEYLALDEELKRRQAFFAAATSELLKAVNGLAEGDRRNFEIARLRSRLEKENGSDEGTYLREIAEGRAASLMFVVLSDRLDGILTTKAGQFSYSWSHIDTQPFSETNLNAKIGALRDAIDSRSSDSPSLGADLYNMLFQQSSFAKLLKESGAEILFLSLDRNLRNMPFAALKTPEGFLVEKYDLVLTTGLSGRHQASSRFPSVAGFGLTLSRDGFPALSNAAAELGAIVKQGSGSAGGGVFAGTVKLNEQFTMAALQDAFVRLPDDSSERIVHIASHFKLGETDRASFLLLGDGSHLTIEEIKKDSAIYDFSNVSLLALSACSTGYSSSAASPQSVGLESFAAISQNKGARSILATLWPVVDQSTAKFMGLFYRMRAEQNLPFSRALAMAQRDFIASNARAQSDPFFWSGFVLLSNSR